MGHFSKLANVMTFGLRDGASMTEQMFVLPVKHMLVHVCTQRRALTLKCHFY